MVADSTASEEYGAGETESDVSLDDVSPAPLKAREAKKGVKLAALNGHASETNKKNDTRKKAEDQGAKKPADKSQNKESKPADKSQNKESKDKTPNKSAKKPETPKSGSSVDKQQSKTGGKDSEKSADGKKGISGQITKQVSPLRMAVGL